MSRIWRRFCDAPEVKTAFAIDKSTPKQLSVLKQSSDLQQVPGGCLWATLLSGVSPDFHNILTKKKKRQIHLVETGKRPFTMPLCCHCCRMAPCPEPR